MENKRDWFILLIAMVGSWPIMGISMIYLPKLICSKKNKTWDLTNKTEDVTGNTTVKHVDKHMGKTMVSSVENNSSGQLYLNKYISIYI